MKDHNFLLRIYRVLRKPFMNFTNINILDNNVVPSEIGFYHTIELGIKINLKALNIFPISFILFHCVGRNLVSAR